MTNVLVLGITGMLGSMVFQYLAQNENLNVIGTARDLSYWRGKKVIKLAVENFNEETFIKLISETKPDYIIQFYRYYQ